MPEYRVAFAEGSSVQNNFGGRGFGGIQHIEFLEADSRVDIFLMMHERYARDGMDLTVITHDGKSLLDFTHDELREIYDRGKISVKSDFPIRGAQIQSIKLASEVEAV
ncbi:MAG TPA: hypothetical protein VK892_20950 [Pyrinomonadaceae bacterium]|nr:hypothetical protein [Pyrinomonadaceae bacterium]